MKSWPFFLLVLTLVRCCSLVSSVGHKQRLKQLQAEQTVDDHEETLPTKHGGHKQRRVEAEQTAATSSSSSSNSANTLPFNNDLVNDWASGKLSSKQVQRYARHALEQGASGLFDFAPPLMEDECSNLAGFSVDTPFDPPIFLAYWDDGIRC